MNFFDCDANEVIYWRKYFALLLSNEFKFKVIKNYNEVNPSKNKSEHKQVLKTMMSKRACHS